MVANIRPELHPHTHLYNISENILKIYKHSNSSIRVFLQRKLIVIQVWYQVLSLEKIETNESLNVVDQLAEPTSQASVQWDTLC